MVLVTARTAQGEYNGIAVASRAAEMGADAVSPSRNLYATRKHRRVENDAKGSSP